MSLKELIKRMTGKELFEEGYRRTMLQGKRCTEGMACCYINKQGDRCALGLLMSEDEARFCEANDFGTINDEVAEYFGMDDDQEYALAFLQNAHDSASGEDFELEFEKNVKDARVRMNWGDM